LAIKSLLGLRRAGNDRRDFDHARYGGSVSIIEIESSYGRDKAGLWNQKLAVSKPYRVSWGQVWRVWCVDPPLPSSVHNWGPEVSFPCSTAKTWHCRFAIHWRPSEVRLR